MITPGRLCRMRIFRFEGQKKSGIITALLVCSEHIGGGNKMVRREERA